MADEADDMLALVERSMASAQSALSRRVVNRKGEWWARRTAGRARQRATRRLVTLVASRVAMAQASPISTHPHRCVVLGMLLRRLHANLAARLAGLVRRLG